MKGWASLRFIRRVYKYVKLVSMPHGHTVSPLPRSVRLYLCLRHPLLVGIRHVRSRNEALFNFTLL